jgi:hypothetical protein
MRDAGLPRLLSGTIRRFIFGLPPPPAMRSVNLPRFWRPLLLLETTLLDVMIKNVDEEQS